MKKCKKEWRTKEGDGKRISGFLVGGRGREGGRGRGESVN
jgi:hypothetical protein